MLNLWQERVFDRGFPRSQASDLGDKLNDKFGDFGSKTKLVENTRNMALSLLGVEMSITFERLQCDVTSYWKRYKKQAVKPRINQLEFGQH
ncbi:hypothetical protein AVEN_106494-1 [Araneus ventricosus]|uniref:Uncharacterized protein n=1 Tax=Araneus ventricosus TaxID=182803 RepID=A0A4Y2V7S7_ARAVE|nr:hypothetical protein AVEN_106494-1 [Araneus ventricosus]